MKQVGFMFGASEKANDVGVSDFGGAFQEVLLQIDEPVPQKQPDAT